MSEQQLRIAVIGVGGTGSFVLDALIQSDVAAVVGLADRNCALAEQAGRTHGLAAYCDNRRLLAETQPHAVFLTVPPMDAPDIINACADRGVHVWKEAPLARGLDEGLALARRMSDAGLKLAVGTPRRFSVGYRAAGDYMGRIGPILLARAHYLYNWGPHLGWRGDRESAGGGALMHVAYHPIDLLVWMLGLPETVYGLQACGYSPGQTSPEGEPLPVYDTDDAAAVMARYSADCAAVVTAGRRSGPACEELSLHGRAGSIIATGEHCLLRDPDGNILDRSDDDDPPIAAYARQIESFARAVLEEKASYHCSGWESLLNLAVIEAAYLSNRTGQPESPLRLLRNRELDVATCLKCLPDELPE